MSAKSDLPLKEFKIKLKRLTKEEIEKHTGKAYEVADQIENSTTHITPKIFVRRDIQADTGDIKTIQGTDDASNTGITTPDVPAAIFIQNDGINNMEIYDTQVENNLYAESNDDFMPTIMSQEEYYVQNYGMINTTAGNENIYNPSNSYIPNMVIKQEVQDDNYGIYTNLNKMKLVGGPTQKLEKIFTAFPKFKTQFAPVSQVAGTSQVIIKQEAIDDSYDYSYNNISQDGYNMYNEYIPDILLNQPAQNFSMPNYIYPETFNPSNSDVTIKQEVLDEDNVEASTNLETTDQINSETTNQINPETTNQINPETTNQINPHIIIKQEILDEGNIEVFTPVYTDVLRPLADQEYEDGSP